MSNYTTNLDFLTFFNDDIDLILTPHDSTAGSASQDEPYDSASGRSYIASCTAYFVLTDG